MKISKEFHQQAQFFLELLFDDLKNKSVEIPAHWMIDHLCYRVESQERYQELKSQFSEYSELLIESPVGGRLISTFKLKEPVLFRGWSIPLVELPAPKVFKKVQEGFEHIEVVSDLPFSEIEAKYPGMEWDRSGLKKGFNQELEMVLGQRNVKFHHQSLEKVIELEKAAIH